MDELQQPDDYTDYNNRSLRRLIRAIELNQGGFSLHLVRCNYASLLTKTQKHLQKASSIKIRYFALPPTTKTLYTAVQIEIGQEQPAALMVSGFESVAALNDLIVATNQVRDNFRNSFPFPLVLWINDEVLKKLMRSAPDFASWASVPIQFAISTADLTDLVHRETDQYFAHALNVGAGRFLRSSTQDSDFAPHSRAELRIAVKELAARGQTLSPVLTASLQFVLGQDAYINGKVSKARKFYKQSLEFWQQQHKQLTDASIDGADSGSLALVTERLGCVLFYFGLWWRRYSVLNRARYYSSCQEARKYYEQCIAVFQQGDRSDLAAKFINALGEVLRLLCRTKSLRDNSEGAADLQSLWDELEKVAKTAVDLCRIYGDPLYLAYGYGLLAEVALNKAEVAEREAEKEAAIAKKKAALTRERSENTLAARTHWLEAGHYAETALQLSKQPVDFFPESQRKHNRSLYHLLLAQAQQHIDSLEQAVETLEIAKQDCQHAYEPLLYTRILEALRDLYFKQKHYLKAFYTKKEQRSIEQIYRLRAFIGAGRLEPERRVTNPGLILVDPSNADEFGEDLPRELSNQPMVAQEIAASGRQHDVEKLTKRLSDDRYPLVIIHGQSGVGKSSIINAGLVPALDQQPTKGRRFLLVVQRVYDKWSQELGTCLANVLTEKGIHPIPELGKTLEIQPLLKQLQDNANCRSLQTVLIFDQFEEFFFTYPNPRDRQHFFEFLCQCINNLSDVKIVLSLREDYLHYLLECVRLDADDLSYDITTDILGRDNRYPLGNFSPTDARLIIERLTQHSQFRLDTDLIQQLVKDLSEELGAVRPIELQVVGSQLQDDNRTTLRAYQALGDNPKETLVEAFLERVVDDCGPENRDTANSVLYFLTDEKGTRPLKTLPELSANLMASDLAADPGKLKLVLEILVESGLVLLLREAPVERYQLVHDYLAALIQQKRKREVNDLIEKARAAKAKQVQMQADLDLSHRRERRLRTYTLVGGVLGVVATTVAVFAYNRMNQATMAEIKADISHASSLLRPNNQLKALAYSVKAGKQLKDLRKQRDNFFLKLIPSGLMSQDFDQLELMTQGNLLETVYGIQEQAHLAKHRQWVNSVSYSPGGELIASTGADNAVILWDKDGKFLRKFDGHENRVNTVSFSSGGQFFLASADDDGTIRLWDLKTKTTSPRLQAHQSPITSITFSHNGKLLVSASDDSTVKLWQTQDLWEHPKDSKPLAVLEGHTDRVKAVSFSPDGTLATASWDGTVKLWDSSGRELKTLNHSGAFPPSTLLFQEDRIRVTSVSFSPNGKYLASGGWDNTVKLWSLETGKLLQTLKGHTDRVVGVGFSPDGQTVISASNDKTIKLWDLDGIERRDLKLPEISGITSISFSPKIDNKILAIANKDTITLLSLDGIKPRQPLGLQHNTPVKSISFSPDGNWIASASQHSDARDSKQIKIRKGKAMLLHLHQDRQVRELGSGNFVSVKFSLNSGIVATGEKVKESKGRAIVSSLTVWTLNGEEIQTLSVQGELADISFGSDDNTLIFARNIYASDKSKRPKVQESRLELWRIGDRMPITLGTLTKGQINSISFTLKGNKIASGSEDGSVRLWSLNDRNLTGKSKNVIAHPSSSPVKSLSFSPDGKAIAFSGDNSISLLSLDAKKLKTLTGHDGSVTSINFSQDGKMLISGSNDGTIKLWNLKTSKQLATLQKGDDAINSVNFSPINKSDQTRLIASASSDGKVSLWQLDLNSLLKRGCEWIGKYLMENNTSVGDEYCK